jgi:hypothetical protein
MPLEEIAAHVGVVLLRSLVSDGHTDEIAPENDAAEAVARKGVLVKILRHNLATNHIPSPLTSPRSRSQSPPTQKQPVQEASKSVHTIQDRSVKISFLNPMNRLDQDEIRKRLALFGTIVNVCSVRCLLSPYHIIIPMD